MNWSDYEAIWKRQELPVGAGADLAALRETFETKRRKLAATLFVRDILEASAGLFVSGVFAYAGWHLPKVAWPIAIAVALILGVTGFFIRERIRAHRSRLGADAPLLAKLEADIAELRHQRRLLLSVAVWYIAPLALAVVIFGITVGMNLSPWAVGRDPLFQVCMWTFNFCLYWFVWVINRRAVRKQIDPRLEELEKLHQTLRSLP
jgi:xanthosine utilization system XapX-like protein